MTIALNLEALQGITVLCGTVCVVVVFSLAGKLVDLRRNRRRDALFERLANEAMASGRPVTFTHDTIKRS